MRLNRYLSLCGLGSRRGSEDLIREGRVSINGAVVKDLATQVKDTDEVIVDGRAVRPAKGVVLVLHKPKGYLCTREDTHDRATIYNLLPAKYQSLHHVGRLDKDSEGLILLTNRGDLSHRLLHPSEGVEKEYEVRLETEFNSEHIPKMIHGVMTAEGFARAERVFAENPWKIHVVLKQGLKRQIRLMFYEIGYEVERLVRVRIGGLKLYGLPKGGWKELTESEVERYFFHHKPERRPRPDAPQSGGAEEPLAPRKSLLRERTGPRKRGPGTGGKSAGPGKPSGPGKSFGEGARKRYADKHGPRRPGGPSSRQKPPSRGNRRGGRRPE
ncbi:MAG: pseudouridine synthase [Verrucomicrobiaceae bacterium]|nr:pseudouridine synthase [Verrucomicrobiaceae bacterium]